jgi:hypothetical protein
MVTPTGSARPGNQLVYNGFKLGQWVAVQRTMHRAGQIPTEREARLENLPGWTTSFESKMGAFVRGKQVA